jgi:cell wall-associated NlpC family hydrolase
MQHLVLAMLLDDGAGQLARWLGGLAVVGCCVLVLALATPVLMVAAVMGVPLPSSPESGITPAASAPPLEVTDGLRVASTATPPATSAAELARSYLGIPYVFGGTNPAVGLDCSGLVQLVFRRLGIPLPRTAQQQYAATERLTREQLQPGDLVFFARTYADPSDWITHVGIYVGGGVQINAPTEGQVVSIQPVFTGYWGAHFESGGRPRSSR